MLKNRLYRSLSCFLILSGVVLTQAQEVNRLSPPPEPKTAQSLMEGAFIDVNVPPYVESDYEIEQLVSDVLIKGGASGDCAGAGVSNVTISPNQPVADETRAWGFFNKGTTNFPFEAGIVLVSGKAKETGNTLVTQTMSNSPGSGGDADLTNAIGEASLNDAVALEFDFVPTSPKVKFRYILASEEYTGSFPCSFDDGFALLLKKQGDLNYQNLAVLPNNAGPVKVTNIHGPIPGDVCPPINEQYYAGNNDQNIETNFNGRTVPLTAEADVIPGETYHFKLVLADASDTLYDIGVFLEAGSFDIGLALVDTSGVQLPDELTICEGYSVDISSSVDAENVNYQWSLDGVDIPGATGPTYTASEAGIYSLTVTVDGSQCPAEAEIKVNVISGPQSNFDPISGIICDNEGTIVLDAGAPPAGQNYTYSWSTGANSQTITVDQGGIYTVDIDNGVCTETFSTEVKKAEYPVIKDVQYDDSGMLTITAENNGPGDLEYSIDAGQTWQDSNIFNPVDSNIDIDIVVRVKETNCDTPVPFYTFRMINSFSPNEDGSNDVLDCTKISTYKNFSIVVIDKYGKTIFKADGKDYYGTKIWDGRFQGKLLPTDSYWYRLVYQHPINKKMKVKTGWILLKNIKK
ncbi:MAG: hypothetical protein CSA38_00905 [Flavobacteriales bacterium]|nr:MAG: hypothetical protein CSA38_00905 [Flavobacteriales bacterium]